MAEKDSLKIVTDAHTLSFVYIDEPRAFNEGDKPKFEVTVLIPKDHPDVEEIQEAIDSAYEQNKDKVFKGAKMSNKWHNPLRDGDEYLEEHPEATQYEGCYYVKATSTQKPRCWDTDGTELFDVSEIYSGCEAMVSMRCFAFNNKAKGFGFYLNGIKKTDDGERIGGGGSDATIDDFEAKANKKAPAKKTPAKKVAPAPKKVAPKKPAVMWDVDENGDDIYSEDGGETWNYSE